MGLGRLVYTHTNTIVHPGDVSWDGGQSRMPLGALCVGYCIDWAQKVLGGVEMRRTRPEQENGVPSVRLLDCAYVAARGCYIGSGTTEP